MIRRRFLFGAGAAAGLAAVGGTAPRVAVAGDPYDELRAAWYAATTGGDFDPTDPDYAAAVHRLDTAVTAARSTLDHSAGRTRVFTDLPLGTNSAHVTSSYGRLSTMATGYATAGTRAHGNADLLAEILAGLATAHDRAYHDGQREYGNWWDWEIGTPKLLGDICVLLYDKLPADLLAGGIAAVDHFVPDPTKMFPPERGPIVSTGANRVDLCQVVGIRGLLGRSDGKLAQSRDGLSAVFGYATSGDGFYRDGSFVQHTHVAYTGTYGLVLLGGLARLLALYQGSRWEVTDPNRQILYEAVDRAYTPVVFDAQMMDCVRGRAVSRSTEDEHADGHTAVECLLRLAAGLGADRATQAARWRAACRGWLARDRHDRIMANATIPRITLIKKLLADASVRPAPEPVGHHLFAGMDRAVHRRPGWAYAISMASERIAYYEYGNGENLRGWHQGEGMGYLYTHGDNGQYADGFWPTVDPYRLPGTTVDSQPLADGTGGDFGQAVAPTSFAGGAVLAGYAMVGQDLAGFGSTLRARRSWVCLDEYVVALGAGISGGSGHPVETVVENRNLHETGTNPLRLNGIRQLSRQGWSTAAGGTRWAHLDGVAGYVFLDGPATLHAERAERTGRWRDINTGGPAGPLTRRYLTLWLDHGSRPAGASYRYLLVPNATVARTARLAAAPGVRVLANTADAQAVEVPRSGLTALNFFAAGTVRAPGAPAVTADRSCSVLVRRAGRELTVAVADPTHRSDAVSVRIDGTAFTVDTSARDGASHLRTVRG